MERAAQTLVTADRGVEYCDQMQQQGERIAPTSVTRAPETPEPATVALGEGIRLHSIQTGWVAVKRTHRAFRGPAVLRLPAVIADSRWTEWLPVICFAIEHPEGLIIVDTGESARMVSDPEYPVCDPVTGWFYRVNLRFALRPEDEVGPQLERLGLAPESVSTVVLTHRHSDHMGAWDGSRRLGS